MQADFPNGIGPVEEFDADLLQERLEQGAEKIRVFEKGSNEYQRSNKAWSDLTPNQKRNMRRRLKKR